MTGSPPPDTTLVRGACPHDCPDTCAWVVTVRDGQAVKLAGDSAHPLTRGGLCAKVNHYLERVYSPDRVLYPLRRVGPKGSGDFTRVSWADALTEITARLQTIAATTGPAAILPYSYLGTQGLLQSKSVENHFFDRLGATRLVRKVCTGTGGGGVTATMGTTVGMVPGDIVHSRFIVLWGTNTIVTNLHLWPLIREAKAQGATVVVIDPARTRTAQAADWHIQPRPGTDAALALGMMRVIVDEDLFDQDYVEQHTVGFTELGKRLADYPLDRVAAITGVPAPDIARLARSYATSGPAAIRLLVGMEHRTHGAMAYRTIACLPALIGAWRAQGGGLLYVTSRLAFAALNPGLLAPLPDAPPPPRTVNMVQLGRALTDPAMEPPIQALVVWNANPMATTPNQGLIRQGLARDDLFTVVSEQFLTDTARYADYVLPATTQLEHLDLMWSWGHEFLALNQPAIAPRGEAIPNTELFRRLARGMGFTDPIFAMSDEAMLRAALASDHPYLAGITYESLARDGWARLQLPADWRPFAQGRFPTPSGKCEFWSASLAEAGFDPLPAYQPPRLDALAAGAYPLSLTTAKSAVHFLNSSYANLPRHLTAEREPRLDLNAADAAPRQIADGDLVRVFNDLGEVRARARVGANVPPGAVALPSGWWPALSEGGAAANALTPDGLSDWGDGGNFHDAFVEVSPLDTAPVAAGLAATAATV